MEKVVLDVSYPIETNLSGNKKSTWYQISPKYFLKNVLVIIEAINSGNHKKLQIIKQS